MGRLNRTWFGCLLVTLGWKTLPKHLRDEWRLRFERRTVEVPHDFDTSRFDADTEASA